MAIGEVATWIGLLSLPVFIVWDLLFPRRRFDAPRAFRAVALLVSAFTFVLSMKIGELWGSLFPGKTVFDGAALGTWAGAVVGILVYELAHYWYHRSAHRFDWLWRSAHQMHHSAESIETLGAYYLHPLDTFFFTTIGSVVFFPLLGLAPEAGAVAAAFISFNAAFQHANIRTPRWLGYLIQRPESHGVHHARGVHAYNYADLPLWDMVFGTFKNPERFEAEAGFYKAASLRIPEMLVGRDVSTPAPGLERRDVTAPVRNAA